MADKQNVSSEDDTIESIFSPREAFSQAQGDEIPIVRPGEPTSRIYYPPFVENQLLLMVQPRNRSASNYQINTDVFYNRESLQESHLGRVYLPNQFLPRRQVEEIGNEQKPRGIDGHFQLEVQRLMHQARNLNRKLSIFGKDAYLKCEFSNTGRNDEMGHLSAGRYGENFKCNVLPSGQDEDIREGQEFPSSRPVSLNEYLLERNVVDVAKQLLSVSDKNKPHAESSNTAGDLSLSDISIEYCKLYTERSSVNYDFAMNLMAYIELLNDRSWKATISYFDENVKRMVKQIWNKRQDSFTNTIDLQRFNRKMVLKLMLDFTQWSVNRNFELEEFLNYCVLMCQLGVNGRKEIFKEAPLYAIGQLRDRVKLLKFENFAQFLLGIAVKDHAMRIVEHSKV